MGMRGQMIRPDGTGVERNAYVNALQRELNTRYRNTIYPSKLFLGYTAPGIDLTVGDFYAQFGRGLVLSVRKIDELATDTTIRGAKASFKKSWESASLSVTTLAGQANPIRIDEQTTAMLRRPGARRTVAQRNDECSITHSDATEYRRVGAACQLAARIRHWPQAASLARR